MKTTKTSKSRLATTPLRDWPPQSILAEAARAAKLWSREPAFTSGGPLDDIESRAQEIAVRMLDYLSKKPHQDEIDQVAFFYQIAAYCKPGIIQSCYHIQTVLSDTQGDEAGGDDEYAPQEMYGAETQGNGEGDGEAWQNLMLKIGVGERDVALFQTPAREWVSATGLSERQHREMKSNRRKEIIDEIRSKKLGADLARLMPGLKNALLTPI